MNKKKIPRSVGTHDGSFHADEVTACALLLLCDLIDEDRIVRTRDPAILDTCEYVCDVGGSYDPSKNLFDHHQAEYDGLLSSAGMILAFLKDKQHISPEEYDFYNQSMIIGVDAHDNGRELQKEGVCTISHVVSNFSPIEREEDPKPQTQAFHQALHFVYGHLKRMRERYRYVQSCNETIAAAMKRYKDCIIFEENIPWQDCFFRQDGAHHPALFIIMPSGQHWILRGIPPSTKERMKVRLPLPQEWAGLLEDNLKTVSGIPGAIFCHKGRFISVWETKEDALKALEYTLRQQKK